jgi:hypothetical protein
MTARVIAAIRAVPVRMRTRREPSLAIICQLFAFRIGTETVSLDSSFASSG